MTHLAAPDSRPDHPPLPPLSSADLNTWETDGYAIARGMYDRHAVDEILAFFDGVAAGDYPEHWQADLKSKEPLKRYPRVMQPHRWNPMCLGHLLKPEIDLSLRQLLGEPAVACQLMFFFKPPGSPGQSLHQDNFYLSVAPTTCIAAWTAIDQTDFDNGGLLVVPGTHRDELQCPDEAEFERTQRTNIAEIPKGKKVLKLELDPGDTLFFNGSLIHGSGPNRSKDRWRRSFIGHYMPTSSTHVNSAYFPIYNFDGREVSYEAAAAGGPCGYKPGAGPNYNSYGVDAQF